MSPRPEGPPIGQTEDQYLLNIVDQPRNKKAGEPLSQDELDELFAMIDEPKKTTPTLATIPEQKKTPKTLTPEIIQKIYLQLNNFEKMLVFSGDSDFTRWLDEYEKKLRALNSKKILGEKASSDQKSVEDEYDNRERDIYVKIGNLRSMHRLVQAADPRAALIIRDRPNIERMIAEKLEALKNKKI